MSNGNKPLVMLLGPGHWAGHMRVYHRHCLTLAQSGYQVLLAAHPLPEENYDYRVHLHSLGEFVIPTLNWRLVQRIKRCNLAYRLAVGSGASLFHYYSPEFIFWGARLKKILRRPIVLDCMEDFESYVLLRPGIGDYLRGSFSHLVGWQLKYAARYCDAVTVADEGTAALLRPFAQRVVVLHNYPMLSLFPDPGQNEQEKQFDIVFHGGISRGLLEFCFGVDDLLVDLGYAVKWRFIGLVEEMDWFTKRLSRRGVKERFSLTGLVPHDQISQEITKAKIGIIPLPDHPKYHNNIPQKLFEFMALRMPVVLSDLPPSRPFVGNNKCAIMVPPDDYHAYAQGIIQLLKDPSLRKQMGAEGHRLVVQEYNWEKESKKLVNLYEELLSD